MATEENYDLETQTKAENSGFILHKDDELCGLPCWWFEWKSLWAVNSFFSVMSLNGVFSLLVFNALFSVLCFNAVFSIASMVRIVSLMIAV